MIRRLVVIASAAAAALGASAAGAQTVGFKAGAAFPNWNIDAPDAPATDPLTSFKGGGFIRFDMGGFWLQPELLVVNRGAEIAGTGTVRAEYLELPLLAILPIATGSEFTPYLLAGPDVAYEVFCQLDESPPAEDYVECHHEIESVPRRRWDAGVTFGGGFEFPAGPGALLLEGRYSLGLLNISRDSEVDIRSRAPSVLAGYSLPLWGR